ncbi:MAG TPA: MBL fold metallo-hydrolase [Solirubrobacteraceae bacterium]|nr:MBL fold metallo-hydrolase [Solirubrobacteraceae bacterium]
MTLATPTLAIPRLHASDPEPLPFAPSSQIRSYLLERDAGNLLVYSTTAASGDAWRQYLGHGHEAGFPALAVKAPLFVHAADRAAVEEHEPVRAAFSRRHTLDDDFEVIPIPGHTPGSTAYLWDTGDHRLLFTADTIMLRDGDWRAAVLPSSDRAAYLDSLVLLRELDFDVLVPWVAAGAPYALTDGADARHRIDAIIDRVRRGAGG